MHKLSKHYHVIYGAAKDITLQERQIGLLVNKLEFRAFANSRKAETSSYGRRLINKSSNTFVFCRILFNEQIFHHVRKSRGPSTTYVYTEAQDLKTRCLGLVGQSTINILHYQPRLYDDEVSAKYF